MMSHLKSGSVNQCYLPEEGRTILPNFTPSRFETTEL